MPSTSSAYSKSVVAFILVLVVSISSFFCLHSSTFSALVYNCGIDSSIREGKKTQVEGL